MRREAFNYLLLAFQANLKSERISELRFDFPDCWQEIIASEAFIPKGVAQDRLIRVDYGDEESDGYRQVHKDQGQYVYYFNGRHVVTDDDLRMFAFRLDWFPRWLSHHLKLSEPTLLVDEVLWCLGESLGVTVLLARELRYSLDEILDAVESQEFQSTLVLASNVPSTKRLTLPAGCQLLDLNVVLPMEDPVRVDYNLFLSYIDPVQGRLEREGILWDEHNGILRVLGQEPWILKGAPGKCRIVNELFNAGRKGSPRILTQWLLEESTSGNLSQFFHRDEHWKHFIAYERGAKGRCWLKAFEELPMFQKESA